LVFPSPLIKGIFTINIRLFRKNSLKILLMKTEYRRKIYKQLKINLIMKKGKNNFKFSNRVLYSLITLGILIAVGVGVYAATYTASGAGHPYTEISTCATNQTLKMNADGTAWTCMDWGYEIVVASVKDQTSVSVIATCPTGKKVIGGGCIVQWNDPYPSTIQQSSPAGESAWKCLSMPVNRDGELEYTGSEIDKKFFAPMTAYAICVNA